MKKIFCEVIVDIAHSNIDRVFDYLMPENMNAGIGYRVLVPFGNKNIEGIILRFKESTEVPEDRLKAVSSVLDDMPIVTEDQIELAGYLCVKYRTTMAFALRLMFPAKIRGNRIGEKAEKVLVLISEEALQTEIATCYTKDGRIKAKKKLGILRTLSSQKKIRYSEAGGALASRLQEKGIVSIEEADPHPLRGNWHLCCRLHLPDDRSEIRTFRESHHTAQHGIIVLAVLRNADPARSSEHQRVHRLRSDLLCGHTGGDRSG